jgi:dTDP-4-dehydrorhamnose 3,5-epimerase
MHIQPLKFPKCWRILPKLVADERGMFVKTYVDSEYRDFGFLASYAEEYFSYSIRSVLRGLHFQTPPHEYFKVVSCLYGRVRDVIVDLRVGSPTYQQYESMELDAQDGYLLYLPPGIAHGFLVQSETAILAYKVSSHHSPAHDAGIRWDSIPVDWGMEAPVLSARDQAFPALSEFISPFLYHPT